MSHLHIFHAIHLMPTSHNDILSSIIQIFEDLREEIFKNTYFFLFEIFEILKTYYTKYLKYLILFREGVQKKLYFL